MGGTSEMCSWRAGLCRWYCKAQELYRRMREVQLGCCAGIMAWLRRRKVLQSMTDNTQCRTALPSISNGK